MKNKNILGLVSTHSIKPILLVGLILCVLQFGCAVISDQTSLHMIINNPFIKYAFLGVFIFATMICGEMIKTSLSKLTLNRLGVSKKRMFCDITLNSAISLIIIWGFQFLSLILISAYFLLNAQDQFINPQTIYLASFRSNFFHLIIPMGDFTLWFSNISFVFMISTLIARYILANKKDSAIIYIYGSVLVHIANNGINHIIFAFLYISIGVYQLYKGVPQNEENN